MRPASTRSSPAARVHAESPLDVDYAAETFHHDSVADGAPTGGSGGEATDFDSFAAAEASLTDLLVEQAVAVL